MKSTIKGDLAQLKVETAALEKGYVISRPATACRYDLIVDDGQKLWRVQVKYANGKSSNTKNSVVASLNYTDRNRKEHCYTADQIDAMAIYVPQVDKVLWLSADKVCGKSKFQIKINGRKGRLSNWYENFIW